VLTSPTENSKSLSEQIVDIWRRSDPDDNCIDDYDDSTTPGYVFSSYMPLSAIDRRLTFIEDFMYECYAHTEWQISALAAYGDVQKEWQERFELGDSATCFFLDLADFLVDNNPVDTESEME